MDWYVCLVQRFLSSFWQETIASSRFWQLSIAVLSSAAVTVCVGRRTHGWLASMGAFGLKNAMTVVKLGFPTEYW